MMKTVHFIKTREYLNQVKEAAQKVEMLKTKKYTQKKTKKEKNS